MPTTSRHSTPIKWGFQLHLLTAELREAQRVKVSTDDVFIQQQALAPITTIRPYSDNRTETL
jgi:hypothetical protein